MKKTVSEFRNLVRTVPPLLVTLLILVIAFGALIANRPYREAFDIETALTIMVEEIKCFDMHIFLTFQQVSQSEEMRYMLKDMGIG